jgi:hypothetical protein
MCPNCISTALLLLTGGSSAGGLTLVAARVFGAKSPATGEPEPENRIARSDPEFKSEAGRSLR